VIDDSQNHPINLDASVNPSPEVCVNRVEEKERQTEPPIDEPADESLGIYFSFPEI
jgi:hypothetical protein